MSRLAGVAEARAGALPGEVDRRCHQPQRGRFVLHDGTRENMGVLWQYVGCNGQMVDLHTDRAGIFTVAPRAKESAQPAAGGGSLNAVRPRPARGGNGWIPAYSPQGRDFSHPRNTKACWLPLPERLKALFAIAYDVGTRKGELRKIKWSQVDFDAQCIRLHASQTKGKKAREFAVLRRDGALAPVAARTMPGGVASGYSSTTPDPWARNCVDGVKPAKPLASVPSRS
jgi:hypothetical protein